MQQTISSQIVVPFVASFWHVTTAELKSPRRLRHLNEPRQVAMYLLRKHTSLSLKQIGAMFGDRDHTTIISGVKRIETRLKKDADLAAQIKHLESILIGPDKPTNEAAQAIQDLHRECILLAKLSAPSPQFFSPVEAWEAMQIRDRVIAEKK